MAAHTPIRVKPLTVPVDAPLSPHGSIAGMRLVQLSVPADVVDGIVAVLEDEEIDYTLTPDAGNARFDTVCTFVLPTSAVEGTLELLRERGLSEAHQTVVIETETVISRKIEELDTSTDRDEHGEDQIAREELVARANELTPSPPLYVTMTVISAIVATAGLLLDSAAVVVGSMVIAPLIGPALSASVGTVVNDSALFRTGFKNQVLGVIAAIVAAALFAWIVNVTHIVPPGVDVFTIPEVSERLRPELLALFIALGAGVAGILSLTTGISTALVGVMIAAALIPPAAAAGISLAWAEPMAAAGATVLVLVNLLSINLMGLLTLRISGYRPQYRGEEAIARRQLLIQIGLYGFAVTSLAGFLGASTVTAVRHAEFEADVERVVRDLLADTSLTLRGISVSYTDDPVFASPELVTVSVGGPNGIVPDGIIEEMRTSIAGETGYDVAVEVSSTYYDRSD